MKPIILITMSNADDSSLANITGDTMIIYSDQASAQAIIAAGGIPFYVPAMKRMDDVTLTAYLNICDGLLITGADTCVNPSYYGEKLETDGRIDSDRDQLDMALIKLAHSRQLPILGICKGMQIINVAFGGTLFQDVDRKHSGIVKHDTHNPDRSSPTHIAKLPSNSVLRDIFKTENIELNGGHRQAVKKLGGNLQASALADDDVVEALQGSDDTFLLGIQFHAELNDKPAHTEIFARFVRACSKHSNNMKETT
jgi:gamma-glutamyl-gamma-aminobutyrate hydrolase PuuD